MIVYNFSYAMFNPGPGILLASLFKDLLDRLSRYHVESLREKFSDIETGYT